MICNQKLKFIQTSCTIAHYCKLQVKLYWWATKIHSYFQPISSRSSLKFFNRCPPQFELLFCPIQTSWTLRGLLKKDQFSVAHSTEGSLVINFPDLLVLTVSMSFNRDTKLSSSCLVSISSWNYDGNLKDSYRITKQTILILTNGILDPIAELLN
jgi:hypothetical protein